MFLNERIECPNPSSSYGDSFAVQVTSTLVNRYAVLRHPYVQTRFTLQFFNETMREQLRKTVDIFHRAGGMAGGCLFKHYADFSTNNYIDPPTNSDQLLQQVGPTTYQLMRWYGPAGGTTPRRRIKKPVVGSVTLSIFDGSVYTPTIAYTIDYNTGIVTMNSPLSSFQTLYGGAYFDIPVAFETDLNDVQWQGADIMSTNINLVEHLNPESL